MKLATLFDLQGRRALVTGGNSGIGAAMARALGLAGAQLLLVARRSTELRLAVQSLQADGIQAQSLAAELVDTHGLHRVAKEAEERLGGIDILVNAAGVNLRQPFGDVTPEAWQTQIALHLGAPFFLTQALAPGMAQRGWGASSTSLRCRAGALFPTVHPMAPAKAAWCNSREPWLKNGRARASPATP